MKTKCYQCKTTDYWTSHGIYENGKVNTYCDNCWKGETPTTIVVTKEDARAAHWNEIRSRVTTHEGEMLSGEQGRRYQQKWSDQYLGKDLGSVPQVNRFDVERHQMKNEQ